MKPRTPSSRAIPKPYFILQLCWYSEQLARLQGSHRDGCTSSSERARRSTSRREISWPTTGCVRSAVHARDRGAGARRIRLRLGHCHVCGYATHCEQQREDDDHLSLVAGMRRDQVERLNTCGVTTVEQLGRN